MKLWQFPHWLRDTMLCMFPHRAPTGLVRVGNPGRDSPVLLHSLGSRIDFKNDAHLNPLGHELYSDVVSPLLASEIHRRRR